MEMRLNAFNIGSKTTGAFNQFGQAINQSTIEKGLKDLICFRVSQINGCAFCLDMHAKDLRADGESEQRLYVLQAWREAPFYSERERAALAYAEALTTLNGSMISDELFREVKDQFNENEIVDLTMAIIAINGYNRINLAFGAPVGAYRANMFEKVQPA